MTLRLGLVGCGRLAEHGYVPAIAATPGVALAALVDPDPRRRALVASLAGGRAGTGIATHDDVASLLAGGAVDAVVLASPAEAHLDDATRVAAAGLPALVEKPPAPDAVGAAALAALDPAPHVAFNRRFARGLAAVRRALPVRGAVELRLALHYRRQSWGAVQVRADALADLGPHLVDWARWLLGAEVDAVEAVALAPDDARLTLHLGAHRAHLHAAADRLHQELVEARGPSGAVVARQRVGGPVAAVTGRLRPGPHPLVTSLRDQLVAFAGAARGRPAPDLGTAADGAACMAVLDAARTADGRRSPTPVAPQETPCSPSASSTPPAPRSSVASSTTDASPPSRA
ncbi:Gfo/Idh/MocA family oxidoreductase [Iamia majanohamensis]|uniref:Gfo/Idh/MocA family oxidoreductase n=1 Tax=Iamia majanohamensis TaxID=467976 RepID=A0AAE9YB30_9ACTN|nr:Gfo/Idh/MocA family oxidoreductase [Iamia majanohamensis]WCO65732.1 Gfo/Idh/MocA family oxidoreductase [Iamia majanohamensis]